MPWPCSLPSVQDTGVKDKGLKCQVFSCHPTTATHPSQLWQLTLRFTRTLSWPVRCLGSADRQLLVEQLKASGEWRRFLWEVSQRTREESSSTITTFTANKLHVK